MSLVSAKLVKYLDCGNPKCGFARIRCPDCGTARLLMFSCKTRGFCPTCHAKCREEWGEWMREKLILRTSHRQVVSTIPKMLRIFFKFNRSLLSDKATTRKEITPGLIAVIQSFGSRINFHPHLHFLVTKGGTDKKGQFHKISALSDSSSPGLAPGKTPQSGQIGGIELKTKKKGYVLVIYPCFFEPKNI